MRKLPLTLCLAASFSLAFPAMAVEPPAYTYGATPSTSQPALQYDSQGNYVRPQPLGANDEVWTDEDGQYRCKRKNGTTGLVIGAAIGGLLGNQIAGRGNRTLGTIIGAVGGGLLGRSIEKGKVKCR